MITKRLFEAALGIEHPWFIKNISFDSDNSRLDINLDFKRGWKFNYNEYSNLSVHDTVTKQWKHLNFFQHECYLTCRVPRVELPDGKIKRLKVPWEGENSGFTLLLEAFILQLCIEMPVNAAARIVNIDDNKIWRILKKYVDKALASVDLSEVQAIGVDETSMKKHHNYITVIADLDAGKTIFVTPGRDSDTVEKFADELMHHNAAPEQIREVTLDMSPAFIKGVSENLPNAAMTFDKFHIMKLINDAVGKVRKNEAQFVSVLKGTKHLFEKNRQNLSTKELDILQNKLELKSLNLQTVRAYHLREAFQELYKLKTKDEFEDGLESWYSWARRCRLKPMKEVAMTVKKHWDGVLRWFESRITNAMLEGINSLIQSAKAKARGFRTFHNFRTIIFLITGDLDFATINKHYINLKA